MSVWGLGMRMRVLADALWSLLLGVVLLAQSAERNGGLADRLEREHWTPHMVGVVMLCLAAVKLAAVCTNTTPVAATAEGASCLVFVILTWAVWPSAGHGYGFPIFTGYVAMSQALSLLIMANDWGRS